jgi:Mn-containing catalase
VPAFASVYYNMSQGEGEVRGAWNQGADWDFISDRDKQMAVDGGAGDAEVALPTEDIDVLEMMAARTLSDPMATPRTGAELGMMQSASGGTIGSSSGNAMGEPTVASRGGPLDDTGIAKKKKASVKKTT